MEPSLPRSHLLLQQLGALRTFRQEEGELPQLNAYRYSTDLKVQDHSKSTFQKWTSGEDWYNWVSFQQPGLKNLPPLLNSAIKDLKNEFKESYKNDYDLKVTLSELDQAYEGLEHFKKYENLDAATEKIIETALEDILKVQVWVKEKNNESLEIKLNNPETFYTPPTGAYYLIPKNITSTFETAIQKKKREAFETTQKLQEAFKDNKLLSPKIEKSLQFIMVDKNSNQNLKNYLNSCIEKDYRAFQYNPIDESKLYDLGFSEIESQEIIIFVYQLAEFAATPETAKLIITLNQLSNNNFYPLKSDFQSLNEVLSKSEKINTQLHQFIHAAESYKKLSDNEKALKIDVEDSFADSIDEYTILENLLNDHILSAENNKERNSLKDVQKITKMFTPVDLNLSRLNYFVDNSYADYFYDENNKIGSVTIKDISKPEGSLEFNIMFDEYKALRGSVNNLNVTMPEIVKTMLTQSIDDSIEEYNNFPKEKDLKILTQFEKDVRRGQAMLREDVFMNINDLTSVPLAHLSGTVSDQNNLVTVAYNAIIELCQPENEHNKLFLPLLQMAVSQISLNGAFSLTLGMLIEAGSKYEFSNGIDKFMWLPSISDESRDIKIKVIRNQDTHDIEKIQVLVDGKINIVEKNMENSDGTRIVVKDAISAKLIYDLKLDDNGQPIVDNFSLNYELSLK